MLFRNKFFNLTLAAILSSTTSLATASIAQAQSINRSTSSNTLFAQVTNPDYDTPIDRLNERQIDHFVNEWVEFSDFLAAGNLTSTEKKLIANFSSLVTMLPQTKEAHIILFRSVGKVMETVRASQHNSRVTTRLRESLFAKFYLDTLKQDETKDLPVMKTINFTIDRAKKYNQVVAVDRTAELVVTEKDLDAAIAIQNFLARQANKPLVSRSQLKADNVQRIFPNLALKGKKFWANAETNHAALLTQWSKLSSQQQNALLNKVFASSNYSSQNQTSASNNSQRSSNQNRARSSFEVTRDLKESARKRSEVYEMMHRQSLIDQVFSPMFDVPSF